MAHPGRGLAQAQRLRGLAVGELLEVAEQDDLAVVVVESASAAWNRRWSSRRRASAAGVSAGSRSCAARSSDERSSRTHAGPPAESSGRSRSRLRLAGHAVPPVRVDDVVARDLPEPEMERQRPGCGDTRPAAGWP